MSTRLRDDIKQTRPFTSAEHEAYVSLGRTWGVLEHAAAELLSQYDVTPTQYNVLRILRGAGEAGLCRNEVRDRMITQVPDTTRLLDRMEEAGLIRRERATADRRFVTTRITEKGLALVAQLDEPVETLHNRLIGHLSQEELETIVELLSRIRNTR